MFVAGKGAGTTGVSLGDGVCVMADEQGNVRHKNFDGVYFWGMVIAMFVALGIFIVLAFTSQVHIGHGQV